jgi:hypothetical protein
MRKACRLLCKASFVTVVDEIQKIAKKFIEDPQYQIPRKSVLQFSNSYVTGSIFKAYSQMRLKAENVDRN